MKKAAIFLSTLAFCTGCATTGSDLNRLSPSEKDAGWVMLFDGESLNGWTPRDSARWSVVNGVITYQPDTGPGFLCTTKSYANFELKVDFWADEVVNSGVFLRCPDKGPISATNSYEVNIFDSHLKWPTGSINEVALRKGKVRSVERWNRYHITAQGNHLVVRLDGRVLVDTHNDREKSGPIGLQQLQGHGMIKFRNIKLRPLKP